MVTYGLPVIVTGNVNMRRVNKGNNEVLPARNSLLYFIVTDRSDPEEIRSNVTLESLLNHANESYLQFKRHQIYSIPKK
jgi:hypothetical protein